MKEINYLADISIQIKINNTELNTIRIDQISISSKLSELQNILNKINNTMDKNNLKFIDLFAGIGGFHQALSKFGFKCVLASEINKHCRDTYTKNYNIEPEGDIKNIKVSSIPNFDILCGGFPCQPFSKAGNQNGFKDTRGNLFFNICDIIKFHKPKYIILENVRNLASHDNGNTWKIIRKKINKLGYNTYNKPIILNTLYFGIPQSRERVVILCKRKDLGDLEEFPKLPTTKKITKLSNIIESKPSIKYNISTKLNQTEIVWNNFIQLLCNNNIDMPKFPIWTDWWDSDGNNTTITKKDNKKSNDINNTDIMKKQKDFYKKYKNWIDKNRCFYKKYFDILNLWLMQSRDNFPLWKGAVRKLEWQAGDELLNMNKILWSPRGSGVRIKKLNYSPTLVAMASMIPIYGPQSRHLTPRECARLQSFPDSFIMNENDKESYKQFGNAVNVKMIEKCIGFLIYNLPLF
jgi:DNA (cytosine-5)-methyltransferase 1